MPGFATMFAACVVISSKVRAYASRWIFGTAEGRTRVLKVKIERQSIMLSHECQSADDSRRSRVCDWWRGGAYVWGMR